MNEALAHWRSLQSEVRDSAAWTQDLIDKQTAAGLVYQGKPAMLVAEPQLLTEAEVAQDQAVATAGGGRAGGRGAPTAGRAGVAGPLHPGLAGRGARRRPVRHPCRLPRADRLRAPRRGAHAGGPAGAGVQRRPARRHPAGRRVRGAAGGHRSGPTLRPGVSLPHRDRRRGRHRRDGEDLARLRRDRTALHRRGDAHRTDRHRGPGHRLPDERGDAAGDRDRRRRPRGAGVQRGPPAAQRPGGGRPGPRVLHADAQLPGGAPRRDQGGVARRVPVHDHQPAVGAVRTEVAVRDGHRSRGRPRRHRRRDWPWRASTCRGPGWWPPGRRPTPAAASST